MAPPKLARDTDNGRYYQDPKTGEMLISVTNVLNEWSIPALAPAAAKVTAEYMMDNLPTAVRCARKPDAREAFLKTAKSQHREVWEKRRDLGSKVHDHAEAHILGRPMPDDEEATPFVEQYIRWITEFGVDIERDVAFAEMTVLHRGCRYGGTADLGVHLHFDDAVSRPDPRFAGRTPVEQDTPSGEWLVDIKTSLTKPASTIYRDMVLQLAALRYAEVALLPDDTEEQVPQFVGVAILNLRQDSYGFVPLTAVADESAHAAFCALVDVAYLAHGLDLKPYKPVLPPKRTSRKGAA